MQTPQFKQCLAHVWQNQTLLSFSWTEDLEVPTSGQQLALRPLLIAFQPAMRLTQFVCAAWEVFCC